MKPFIQDTDLTLYQGDVLEVLKTLPAESVHCVVTSPPYWGLRDYGTGSWDGGDPDCDHLRREGQRQDVGRVQVDGFHGSAKDSTLKERAYENECGRCGAVRVDNQLGLEATPDLYLEGMVGVFREVRRVLRLDGTCWVNMGDSYAGGKTGRGDSGREGVDGFHGGGSVAEFVQQRKPPPGMKAKDLCMIPARLALSLQADGWWLRSQIVWSKPNPMPESVTDRPTTSHEFVYLLTKSPRYFFDQEAVREPHKEPWRGNGEAEKNNWSAGGTEDSRGSHETVRLYNPAGRNLRSVWEIPTQPYPEAHFATYPEELVRRCILAGSSERGCCPECGAPWTREVEVTQDGKPDPNAKKAHGGLGNNLGGQRHQNWRNEHPAKDLGWRPSCDCACNTLERPAPCTVLDPFFGSGTTGLVARKHGRRTIGIELNPSYCELAARRLQQLSLLA